MSKLTLLAVIVSVFCYSNLYGQFELKFYSGIFDRIGLAVEHPIVDHIGIELGGSFRTRKTTEYSVYPYVRNRENNFFINSKIKYYEKPANAGVFFGAYLRYWQNFRTVIEMDTWTEEQKSILENTNGWISTRTHKTSLGVLFGYKGINSESMIWEVSVGAGYSPPTFYVEHIITAQDEVKKEIGRNLLIGYLHHLSFLGHVSFGFRF